jgi:DNA-binding MarR family transcriptional regulator
MSEPLKQAADNVVATCLATRARMLSRIITSTFDKSLRDTGVTTPQMILLSSLEHTGAITPTALCDLLKLDKSTLSRNIDRMEALGWVRREPGRDGRSHNLVMTHQGRQALTSVLSAWKEAQAEAEALLGKTGTASINQIARRLQEA